MFGGWAKAQNEALRRRRRVRQDLQELIGAASSTSSNTIRCWMERVWFATTAARALAPLAGEGRREGASPPIAALRFLKRPFTRNSRYARRPISPASEERSGSACGMISNIDQAPRTASERRSTTKRTARVRPDHGPDLDVAVADRC
ncbi:MAG: hypothetical protein MZV49_22000 [Rhodopseudomonas palustris]|nr:hypothetical protein [Rhodopseudomonas palustris]